MSIITKIGGWLDREQTSLQKVLTRVEAIAESAAPIVRELTAITSGIAAHDSTSALGKVAVYLGTALADAGKVEAFLAAHANTPVATLLRDKGGLLAGLYSRW